MSDPPSAGFQLGAPPPRRISPKRVWLAIVALAIGAGSVGAAIYFCPRDGDSGPGPDGPQVPVVADVPVPTTDSLEAIPGSQSASYYRSVEPIMRLVDPELDGWNSEVFHHAAGKQLEGLGDMLREPAKLDSAALQNLVTADFSAGLLRPQPLQEVFSDGSIVVKRSTRAGGVLNDLSNDGRGAELLAARIRQLAASLAGASDVRVKFKVFRVQAGRQPETTAYFRASGRRDGGTIQLNATWTCRWKEMESQPPRLQSIKVSNYEEVLPGVAGQVKFSDWTQSALGKNPSFGQQLSHGMDHWRDHLHRDFQLDFTGHHGIAVGDVNGDGLDDLYVCQPGGLPNRLYVQNLDGTLTDRSSESGTDWMELTRSALLIDLDNDGDQDLVLAQSRLVRMFSNDGQGRFTPRFDARGEAIFISAAAADYDQDGDLDLFVCGYSDQTIVGRSTSNVLQPTPYHDANNGARNLLLRNDGGWQFSDATAASGMDHNNRRFSFAAAWEDFDNDGDMDLYVSNDFGRNNLYVNNNGRFEDAAARVGVEDISAGMGVTWGDYNNDGYMDLYVSNMFSSAGGRIAYHREFRQQNASSVAAYRRHARGNTLFENRRDGTMADVSLPAAVNMGRWAWGAKFVDLNNDG